MRKTKESKRPRQNTKGTSRPKSHQIVAGAFKSRAHKPRGLSRNNQATGIPASP